MRLLGWMHHKIRQTSIEPFKDFLTGNYCSCLSAQSPLEDQISHTRPSLGSGYGCRPSMQLNEEYNITVSGIESKEAGEEYEEETSAVISELFHGFLAIGTLGSEPIVSEPVTPTFSTSLEDITKEKTEVTEDDLKLINYELDKFLEAEAEEEACDESLARSSYVSTITLSGMQMEGPNAEGNRKTIVFPLQGYLFGSSIELPETKTEFKKEKVSLGEMFRRTRITDEIPEENVGKNETQAKQTHKSAKQVIKRILKKFRASSATPSPSSGDDAANSALTKKTLNKVLKIFHRKVHPENSIAQKEFIKSHKEKMERIKEEGGYNSVMMHRNEDKREFFLGSKATEGIGCYNNLTMPQYGLSCSNSGGNKEYWIKTDADYLVLEL